VRQAHRIENRRSQSVIGRPLGFASMLSMLLLMATAGLWLRSYFVTDELLW
jgi:hypothetical protein